MSHAESLTSHAERLLVHAESLTSHANALARARVGRGGAPIRARTCRIWVQTPVINQRTLTNPNQSPVPAFSSPLPLCSLCLCAEIESPCAPSGLHHYRTPAQSPAAPVRLVERLTVADAIRSVFPKLPWSRPLPRRKGFQRDQVNGCCDRLRCGCQRRVQQAVRIRGGPSCCASARSSTGGSGRRGVFSIARCAAAACFAGHRCCGHV